MRRRAFLSVALASAGLHVIARAQGTTATQLQIDVALAHVSVMALRTRYGAEHPDRRAAEARLATLAASLRAARARGEGIEVAVVTAALDAELADVRARLLEFSQRCGSGHPDMQSAHARAAALEDAIARFTSEGAFYPPG